MLKCPYQKIEKCHIQRDVSGNIVETHKEIDFRDCYLSNCPFYKYPGLCEFKGGENKK